MMKQFVKKGQFVHYLWELGSTSKIMIIFVSFFLLEMNLIHKI